MFVEKGIGWHKIVVFKGKKREKSCYVSIMFRTILIVIIFADCLLSLCLYLSNCFNFRHVSVNFII